MRVNIKGLSNRLDNLRERLNDLFDKLDSLTESELEDIEIETVQRYIQNDDTFNLSIALDILEQADKLDKVLDIIKEKRVDVRVLQECSDLEEYNEYIIMNWNDEKEAEYHNELLTQEEFDLLKEVLL